MTVNSHNVGLKLLAAVDQNDLNQLALIDWVIDDGRWQGDQPNRLYRRSTPGKRTTEDTGSDWHGTLGEKAMEDVACGWQEMPGGMMIVDTNLDRLGTLDGRTLVNSTMANTKRMMDGCLEGSHPSQMKLTIGHRALSTCDYLGNYYVYKFVIYAKEICSGATGGPSMET